MPRRGRFTEGELLTLNIPKKRHDLLGKDSLGGRKPPACSAGPLRKEAELQFL